MENVARALGNIKPPPRQELDDGTTAMPWRVRSAREFDAHQLKLIAAGISSDSVSLQVDHVENDSALVSVRSPRGVPHTVVWDFSMRCLLTIEQHCGELITIEGADRDAWRHSFLAAEHAGAFNADKTPLMLAAEAGDVDGLRAILAANANADINQNTPFGLSALGYAAARGQVEATRVLLDARARPLAGFEVTTLQAGVSGGLEVVRLLLAHGSDVNCSNRYGETALMTATGVGQLEIVQALLDSGANPHLQDKKSRTAFDRARQNQFSEILETLERAAQS